MFPVRVSESVAPIAHKRTSYENSAQQRNFIDRWPFAVAFSKKCLKKNHPLRARARSAGFMRMSLLFWNNAPLFSHISGGHSPWSLFNFLCMHESLCFGKTDEKPILNTFYLKWEQLEQQSRSIFDVVSTFLGGQWLKRCMDFVVRLYLSEFCQLLQI